MSFSVNIQTPAALSTLLHSTSIVAVAFLSESPESSNALPVYEQLATQLSRPERIAFAKVDTTRQPQIAQSFNITATPTFITFKAGREVSRVQNANPAALSDAVRKLATEANSDGGQERSSGGSSSSTSGIWHALSLPRGYTDVNDQIDVKGLELLNADGGFGNARTLFESGPPNSLKAVKGKSAATLTANKPDWVQSDTDEQLMLYVPFQSTLKVHSLHMTCISSDSRGSGNDDATLRPKTLKLFVNQPNILGFEEAEDITATQSITVAATDWDAASHTARVELRFVKFQRVSSLVIFIVDGDGEGDIVRIDRVRVIGEAGEKRAMGKLEKIGDEQGE